MGREEPPPLDHLQLERELWKLADRAARAAKNELDRLAREMEEARRQYEREQDPWYVKPGTATDPEQFARWLSQSVMSPVFEAVWAGKQASEIDKLLPRDPKAIREMIQNNNLDIGVRAKVLEVALLRGGNESLLMLKGLERIGYDGAKPAILYQAMAGDVMLGMPPADRAKLLAELSKSGDQLPTQRAPATQLLHVLLQEGGPNGSHDTRQQVEKSIRELPPEERGRMMYHLRDAVGAREIGVPAKITGFEISVKDFGFGLQWEGAPDTHWQSAGSDILLKVSRELDVGSLEDRRAFMTGYRAADPSLEDAPAPEGR